MDSFPKINDYELYLIEPQHFDSYLKIGLFYFFQRFKCVLVKAF